MVCMYLALQAGCRCMCWQEQEPGLDIGAHAYLRAGADSVHIYGYWRYMWMRAWQWGPAVYMWTATGARLVTGMSMALGAMMSFGCMHNCCPGS